MERSLGRFFPVAIFASESFWICDEANLFNLGPRTQVLRDRYPDLEPPG